MTITSMSVPTDEDLAASVSALIAEIDQRREAGEEIPNGYRMGVRMISAVRAWLETTTGEDLSDRTGRLLYRDVPLYYSMAWVSETAFIAR